MKKIIDIIESIANEKGLSVDDISEALKISLINTAKKVFGYEYEYDVEIDSKQKDLRLYQKVLVVQGDDERLSQENENFISLEAAKELDSELEVGDALTYELSLENLGRTASSTLYKELEFHIQRRVEEDIFQKYKNKIGQRVFGNVVRVDAHETTFIEIGEVRAIMPQKLRIKGEKFRVSDVVKGIIKSVYIDKKLGIQVEISRTSPKFLEELLKLEVPEIKDGIITIHKSARIPGIRAKVALSSSNPRIDPIGSTVGNKGIRINAVSKELNRENIDCIEYSSVPEIFVARSLSPAIVANVKIDSKNQKAIVTIPADQKSKAIGKEGINIRLASMLCGYKIELVEDKELVANKESESKSSSSGNALEALFGE